MRIGFDIDGVLSDLRGSSWVVRKTNPDLMRLYCTEMRTLLDSRLFLHNDDEMFIITARDPDFEDVTRQWCDRFYPGVPVHRVDVKTWDTSKDWGDWFERVAKAKADLVNKLELDVYFEDQPKTVAKLRELCPNTKIIQYGGKI